MDNGSALIAKVLELQRVPVCFLSCILVSGYSCVMLFRGGFPAFQHLLPFLCLSVVAPEYSLV